MLCLIFASSPIGVAQVARLLARSLPASLLASLTRLLTRPDPSTLARSLNQSVRHWLICRQSWRLIYW